MTKKIDSINNNNYCKNEDVKGKYNSFEKGNISTNEFFDYLILQSKDLQGESKDTKSNEESIEEILISLEALIGLEKVKSLVEEILAYTDIQRKRKAEGLNADSLVLHMIFKGNPGTGKTTVARLMGRVFRAKGVLSSGHMIEVERADLVGEYIGHTALRVREQVKHALGGILFIDEAYSLARGGEKDFGKEAIDALVKAMEDHKNNLVLILAGYQEEMENFLKINPGLRSRFPIHMEFEDYSIEELVEIADSMVSEREYTLSLSARAKLYQILSQKRIREGVHSGNARLVRNLIEGAIRRHAVRLKDKSKCTRDDLMTLMREDFK
ncbi:AAA family ATPase [Alkaliphilus hydrothermalis]|uniref:Stage V sporulation protein K n=1 Tax=Alkaliphilus hydrothermalis TaxID=1482730 RepID=A0ABS2NLQ1_9FIRM|nr:AAA family ATPase [Alkaliphilus hydrothermalis]MBM7613840.1 stage V sporulation protein K [Alkaliphilus hydrothermalis]